MLSDGLHETAIDALSMDAVSINAVEIGAVARERPKDQETIANIRLRYEKLTVAGSELKVVDRVSERGKKVWRDGRVTIGLDSGAEISVWPPELCPDVETQQSDASRSGRKYYAPGDNVLPSLPDLCSRSYRLKMGVPCWSIRSTWYRSESR